MANAAIPEGARISNRLDFLNFRQQQFTVDERGHRNGPSLKVDRPQVVLFGSSFSLGIALNDEETFGARLNQQLGPVVYNASGTFDPELSADKMAQIARTSGMEHGWILLEILNRDSFTYIESPGVNSASGLRASLRANLKNDYSELQERFLPALAPAVNLARQIRYAPPLVRVCTLLNMRLYDNRILPNPFIDLYPEEQFMDGRRVLMYSGDVNFARKPDNPSITAHTLLHVRDRLDTHGYHLAVVLLPTSYAVYYPLLRSQDGFDASDKYLRTLSSQLTAGNMATLNLLPIMRQVAVKELKDDRLIYYSDDAHWNALGCEIAARAVAPWLQSLLHGAVASRQ